MSQALRTLISLSFSCGAALYLCPEGSARRVLALLCTAILSAAALAPLRDLDYGALTGWEAAISGAQAEITRSGQEGGERLRSLLLEENCARYLTERGEALGLTVLSAAVEVRDTGEGQPIPYAASIRARGTEEGAEALSRLLREELGIPLERQAWTLNE